MKSLFKFKYIIIILLFIWYSKCYSYIHFPFDATIYGWISHIIEFSMLGIVLINFKKLQKNKNINLAIPIILLVLATFCSILTTSIYNGQPMFDYFIKISWWFAFAFYFILHILEVERKQLLNLIIILSSIYVIIKITEQFTYPNIWFYDREFDENTGDMEMRNGFWRIIVGGAGIFYLAFFYKLENSLAKFRILNSIYIPIGLFVIYLELGRMFYAMSAITFIIIYFQHLKGSRYILYLSLSIIATIIFYNYYEILFGEMLQITNEQLTDSNYIRWLSYAHYWNESIQNIPIFLFGNGQPVSGAYQQSMTFLQKGDRLFISDIGIIGELFEFGAIFIMAFIYFGIRVWHFSNMCQRRYLFARIVPVLIFSIVMSSFQGGGAVFIWAITAYLIDLELKDDQNRKLIKILKN